jgi:fructose-1,6-bisphosphatase/inositol monophosphatase family enzyme/predicted N-acetyltransferase YhbS
MTDITIRPAVWNDRRGIADLIAAMGSHEDVLLASDPLNEFGNILGLPKARALVAEQEGRIVGYAELQARPSSLHDEVEGWLAALAVAPELRQAGVGGRLMAVVEEEARLLGCNEIVLESSTWRNSAHAFYRKLGFRQESAAERFRRRLGPTSGSEQQFLALSALAASRVAAALAPWVGVETGGKEADLEMESVALSVLAPLGLPVLAEEGGWSAAPASAGGRWICLDPVDGSRNMRAGLPPWAFSAALVDGEQSVAGFVCDLASGRRWWAIRGSGAWVDGRPARPRRVGVVGIGSRPDVVQGLPPWAKRIRVLGSTAVELCRVADGSLGGYVGLGEVTVHPQDVAAAAVILAESGACLLDGSGSPLGIEADHRKRLQVVAAPDPEAARDLLAVSTE